MKPICAFTLGIALGLWGCTTGKPGAPGDRAQSPCVDADGDGYGSGCAQGHDCDDGNSEVFEGCLHCARPEQGCACEEGDPPVSCFLPKTEADDGTLMCHEGTRYCRDGHWSGCESVHSYPLPADGPLTGIIDPDAGPTPCSDCAVNCFVIRDNLDPVDGGLASTGDGVGWSDGGGLTLGFRDGGWIYPDSGVQDGGVIDGPLDCMLNTGDDVDCDGIVDDFDPYPFEKPFATTNPAIFLDLAPGETGEGTIDLQFFMNTIDVYFLLDQTDSMNSVKNKLHSALINGTFLGPDVECSDTDLNGLPNNELKDQGVIGGIRCLLRNVEIGAGMLREIPFSTYGNDDEVTFRHMIDMGTDSTGIVNAIGAMSIDRDVDWPDAHPLALYSVATGNGLYMGLNKPGVPPRVSCPAGRWGYPCFREAAIPVVILFTDSPMHEGPPTIDRDFSYDPSRLTITAGSQLSYVSVPSDNDVLSRAFDMADLTNRYVTHAGSTAGMAADYTNSFMTCLPSAGNTSPDAAFTFELATPTSVKISTAGTEFNSAFAIYNHVVDTPARFSSNGTNEESVTALELGDVAGGWSELTGSTAAMNADYAGAFVGCNADDAAPDAVFKFSIGHNARVRVDTSGSTYDAVLSLHDEAPALTTVLTTTNTNEDTSTPFPLGDAFERVFRIEGGDTSAMTANYSDTQIGCSADAAAPDALYQFSLSAPTRVRIDTVGSSFDTVIGLADGALGTKQPLAVPSTAEKQESAFDVADMVRGWYGLSGTTAGMAPNYREAFIGCTADTFSPDAVVRFTLSEATRIRLDTTGSAFDTVVSLHNGEIDPTTPLTTNNQNESASAPMVLGEVDDSWFEVFGGDTTLMQPDYDGAVIGCGADTFSADAVFAFTVASPTRVRVDTLESTFDTVVSLHDNPPPLNTTTAVASGTEFLDIGSINGASRVFTGSSTGLAVNYGGDAMGCGTDEVPTDVAFKFRVATAGTFEINTEGSTYDTAIGVFPATVLDPIRPNATALASNTNEAKASGYDAGPIGSLWKVYSGDTGNMASNMTLPAACGAPSNARDAVFKFQAASARRVRIDTRLSGFDTVVALYDYNTDAFIGCDDNGAGGTASSLTADIAAGSYYVVVKGARSNAKGAYQLSIRDEELHNPIACNDDALPSGRSRLVMNLAVGDYHVVLKGARVGHAGDYVIRFRDNTWWNTTNRIACDDSGGGGFASLIERDLAAGTYYVVLKGDLAVDEGPFKLTVRSLTSTIATTHTLACNNDIAAGNTASRLEADLPAGEYWAVVKGTSGQSGPYQLEMRDIGPSAQGIVLACDDDSGGGEASAIERNLGAGTYYVFVKGDQASSLGAYTLNVSDVGNASTAQLQCDDDSAGMGAASIERDLTAGDYWVVLKGDAATDAGDYTVTVRDMGSATRTQLACTTSDTSTTALPAGVYDVVLKGEAAAASGRYTLTAGNGVTQQATFDPPDWDTTLNALQDNGVRVITVLNCHDNGLHGEGQDCNYARAQAVDVANATDALSEFLQPLVVDIDANGTGIETAVMNQLDLLSGHLTMDVSARIAFDPDPNPGFLVTLEAIPQPGDGCEGGVVGNEFKDCHPGATPRFIVTITNPQDDPVPLNPRTLASGGGYEFRADLIADRRYSVDAVPIYVIPEDVDADYPDPIPRLEPFGEYWQDVSSQNGCTGNERPDWQDLMWTADVPDGTSVTFSVCTADDPAALESCTYTEVATVSGSGTCMTDLNCATGFCAANGVCQTITSGECLSDVHCPTGAACDTSVGQCIYGGQPVYVGGVLGSTNLFTYLRMNISLRANVVTNEGPVVHDWALTYLCRNVN